MRCFGIHPIKTPSHPQPQQQRHLEEELAFFQRQLARYCGDGDCAYERSLQRAYQSLVEHRQRQLASLRAAGL